MYYELNFLINTNELNVNLIRSGLNTLQSLLYGESFKVVCKYARLGGFISNLTNLMCRQGTEELSSIGLNFGSMEHRPSN
jgi:hypothetical protein